MIAAALNDQTVRYSLAGALALLSLSLFVWFLTSKDGKAREQDSVQDSGIAGDGGEASSEAPDLETDLETDTDSETPSSVLLEPASPSGADGVGSMARDGSLDTENPADAEDTRHTEQVSTEPTPDAEDTEQLPTETAAAEREQQDLDPQPVPDEPEDLAGRWVFRPGQKLSLPEPTPLPRSTELVPASDLSASTSDAVGEDPLWFLDDLEQTPSPGPDAGDHDAAEVTDTGADLVTEAVFADSVDDVFDTDAGTAPTGAAALPSPESARRRFGMRGRKQKSSALESATAAATARLAREAAEEEELLRHQTASLLASSHREQSDGDLPTDVRATVIVRSAAAAASRPDLPEPLPPQLPLHR